MVGRTSGFKVIREFDQLGFEHLESDLFLCLTFTDSTFKDFVRFGKGCGDVSFRGTGRVQFGCGFDEEGDILMYNVDEVVGQGSVHKGFPVLGGDVCSNRKDMGFVMR